MIIKDISCVIIAKNAQATIGATLDSLQVFSDVIVYSNNSTDKTDKIAGSYKNVTLIQGEFLGFGPTKNLASTYTKNEWILSLDADEVLSDEFIQNLYNMQLNTQMIYSITRINFYKNVQIKHCWGNDTIVRIYNKSTTSFTEKKVHEKIITDKMKIGFIKGYIYHYPYTSITDFIIKLDRYSTIYAQDNAGKKKSSPTKAFFNATYSFIRTYIFKRGFLDGYIGLVIAFSHAATNFFKYMKLYELNKRL